MFTPNKNKQRAKKILNNSFEPSDFIQLENNQQFIHQRKLQYADKQNVAKQILIQIGESQQRFQEMKPSKAIPLSIDRWVSSSSSHGINQKCGKSQTRNFLFIRNVRSVTSGLTRQKNDFQSNALLKLKEALKKLESPQKSKSKKLKTREVTKNQMLQTLISKRRVETRVSDLIKLKQSQTLKTNGSNNHFQSRKISTSTENRARKSEGLWLPPQPLDTKKMNQLFNFNCKQARKNRTLKGILN